MRFVSVGIVMLFGLNSVSEAAYVDLVLSDPGLVSYWRFEDEIGMGTTAADSNAGANPGTYLEGIVASEGVIGQAAFFQDEDGGVVEIANPENFNFTETMSLEAWFKTDELTRGWQGLVGKGDSQYRLHRLRELPMITFATNDGSAPTDMARDTEDLPDVEDGQWHHIVGTFDFADSLGAGPLKRLYLDGELIGEQDAIGPLRTECGVNCELPVMIGGNSQQIADGFRAFSGWIDEVAIYDRALSEADVMEHFLAEKAVGGLPGDYDGSGVLDTADINLLIGDIVAGTNTAKFDVTGDAVVDSADLSSWARDLKRTWIGDANLDGEFNSGDLVAAFTVGKYETGEAATWEAGDFNGDQLFDSGDFVVAFSDGGFEQGPRAAVAAVPEPSCGLLLLTGLAGLFVQRKNRRKVRGPSKVLPPCYRWGSCSRSRF